MDGLADKTASERAKIEAQHRDSAGRDRDGGHERDRAEQELRESEENWRTLAANVPDVICTTDRRGMILFINRVLPGYDRDRVIGSSTYEYVDPQFHVQMRAGLERVFDCGEPFEIDVIGAGSPGETHFYHTRLSPVRRGGAIVAALLVATDITPRKRVEEALRESQALYHSLVEHLPQYVYRKDVLGRFTFAGLRFCALLGRASAAIVGKTDYDFFPNFLADKYREDDRRVLANGATFETVEEHQMAGGARLLVHVVKTAVRAANGAILGTQGVFWDITERAQAEEQLRASETLLRQLFECSPDAIFVEDLRGRVLQVNEAACRLHGMRREELVGKQVFDLVPADQRGVVTEAFPRLAAGELLQTEGFSWNAQRGAVPVELRARRIDYASQPALLLHVRDITERKHAEEERRRLEAQVLHAQKMESLGILAGGVAHDFNNLLTAMLGFASLARLQMPADAPGCTMLHEIENAAERAADLAKQMLAYSGKGKFDLRVFRLDTLVREMTMLLETVVSKKAALHLELAPATIEGDPTQIRQVVMNLITNASDALEGESGLIFVRSGVRRAAAADLRSDVLPEPLPPGDYAFIEVQDPGCGMNDETLAKIFDPFFTTKFTGRGLGLAAVLGIVRGHRGTIKVASAPRQGCTVQVLFPCAGAVAHEPSAARPACLAGRRRGAILVVDDEERVREYVRQVLEGDGLPVHAAADGHEALALLAEQRAEIAAVILDVTMPRLDGFDVLRRLADLGVRLPVLLMSGYSEQDTLTRAAGLGARGFLQKPFRPDELRARLLDLLPADERER